MSTRFFKDRAESRTAEVKVNVFKSMDFLIDNSPVVGGKVGAAETFSGFILINSVRYPTLNCVFSVHGLKRLTQIDTLLASQRIYFGLPLHTKGSKGRHTHTHTHEAYLGRRSALEK